MSQTNKQKKTANNKKNEEEQTKHKGKRKISWTRVMGLLTALIILVSCVGVGINLFGSVSSGTGKMSSETNTSSQITTGVNSTAAASTKPNSSSTAAVSASSASGGPYVQPAGADWNLKLVNAWNPLDSSYQIPLTTISGDNQYDSRAADQLKALMQAGSAYNIKPASLYRSIELQTKLFNNQVNQAKKEKPGESQADAEKDAATWVARPWTSEHNLGLAADLLFGGYSSLEDSMDKTDAFQWLQQHCADYGFILRYPKNKVSVTGVQYEPWHYRYVGVDAAHEIMSRGITLEEYLQEKGK